MIDIHLRESNKTWFGLACDGEKVVATAVDSKRLGALNSLTRSLPSSAKAHVAEEPSEFARETLLTLEELHKGTREPVSFALASEYLTEPRATVLGIAAQIPVGYVASYGDIAELAGTDARAVGQFMATNPLYPIVPCHRVVGSDFSLVGYGGGKKPSALKAKLARLMAECRGFKMPEHVPVNGAALRIHPAERVVEKARKRGLIPSRARQSSLTSY
jgi:methylated-DNA-[protein]-cysteine S-methyltransferase